MKLAVVTGAAGHLGNTHVRHLVAQGIRTRVVLHTRGDDVALDGLDVERVVGDVTDAVAMRSAVEGAEVVFHIAGLVSITTGRQVELERVNVGGTRTVVEACKAAGVRKLVYTGSIHALTEPSGPVIDEACGFDPALAYGPYGKSKAGACRLVQEAARRGELDATIVLPVGCVGPWDFRFSEMGNLVARVGQGRMPIIVGGGYDWVDVRDVAVATLAAAERGRTGEAYLLTAAWMSTVELCRTIAEVAGVRPPLFALPLWFAKAIAVFGPPWERLTGRRALVTPYAMHTISAHFKATSEKARRELGFSPRPLRESLSDAWQWLSTHPASPVRSSLRIGPGRTIAS